MNHSIYQRKFRTDFLFAKDSFLSGIGCIFDIGGNFYNYNGSKNGNEADYKALQSDWGVIGREIAKTVETETQKVKAKAAAQ